MMDATLKAKWVEALRSGKYKQGKDRLRTNDNCFCCLGVLCDIVDSDKWVKVPDNVHEGTSIWAYKDGDRLPYLYLTPELCERFGLPDDNQSQLSMMNDNRIPFDKIADTIKRTTTY